MARKSRRSKTQNQNIPRRGNISTPRQSLHRKVTIKPTRGRLQQLQDNRRFSPVKKELRPLIDLNGAVTLLKAQPLLKKYSPTALFQADKKSLLCARRAIRKEVIFAKGRGGKGNAKPRYNHQSKIGC